MDESLENRLREELHKRGIARIRKAPKRDSRIRNPDGTFAAKQLVETIKAMIAEKSD